MMPSNVNRKTPALARARTLRGADADSAAARNERRARRARDGAADDARADNENGESPFVEDPVIAEVASMGRPSGRSRRRSPAPVPALSPALQGPDARRLAPAHPGGPRDAPPPLQRRNPGQKYVAEAAAAVRQARLAL